MHDFTGHVVALSGIDELYLAAGAVRDDDVRTRRVNAGGFFIGDFF